MVLLAIILLIREKKITFLISTAVIFSWILKEITSSRSRMVYAGLLILPLLITSQMIAPTTSDSTMVIKTRKISVGVSSGNFENALSRITGTTEGGCNQYETEYFKQKYTLGGAGYSIKDEYPEKKFITNYGVNMYLGQNSETVQSTGLESKDILYGINPFFKIDANWIGIGGGIHAGNLLLYKNEVHDQGDHSTGVSKLSVYPQVYFRLGPRRIIFADYHIGDQFPSPFPSFCQQVGIGTGFGSKNMNLRIGGFVAPESGGYLSSYFPVGQNLSFEPMIVWSNSQINQFSIAIHYNLSSNTFYRKSRHN